MILGVHHIQITIPEGEEEKAKDFYCRTLGLLEISKPASLQGRGGFWIQVGDRAVHIGTENGVDRILTKAHVAYDVDDIPAMKRLLTAAGIKLIDSVPIPGYDRFEFRDPFGNRVECIKELRRANE